MLYSQWKDPIAAVLDSNNVLKKPFAQMLDDKRVERFSFAFWSMGEDWPFWQSLWIKARAYHKGWLLSWIPCFDCNVYGMGVNQWIVYVPSSRGLPILIHYIYTVVLSSVDTFSLTVWSPPPARGAQQLASGVSRRKPGHEVTLSLCSVSNHLSNTQLAPLNPALGSFFAFIRHTR